MGKLDFSVVKSLRIKSGLTVDELSRKSGLTRATISKIESINCNPTFETLTLISRIFKIKTSELIKMAESKKCEFGIFKSFKNEWNTGLHIKFDDFEIIHCISIKGFTKISNKLNNEDMAEICFVIKGKLKANINDKSYDLKKGMALRFNSLMKHSFDILENSEYMLIHHKII